MEGIMATKKQDELKEKGNKEKQLKELELEKDRLDEKIKVLESTIEEYGEKKIIAGCIISLRVVFLQS